jgi:FkbM family methyltransferase
VNLRFRVTGLLERGGLLLRRLGLGPLVERARDRLLRLLAPFEVRVGAAHLSGTSVPHLSYLRDLQAGRESFMTALFEARCRPAAEVVDIGAHLGYLTQVAAAHGAHVWAFEPNAETRELLERGLRRSGLERQVTVMGCALSNRSSAGRLFVSGGGDTSSLFDHTGAERAVEITCRRGDEVLGDLQVDVLKLDIEGGEVAALEGLEATLRRASSELAVFAECNPEALRQAGHDPQTLVGLLRSHDLEVFACDEERRMLVAWDDFEITEPYVNLYATRTRQS